MRMVLVCGGVISGVGKGETLVMLDVLPTVSKDPNSKLNKPILTSDPLGIIGMAFL